MLKDSPRWTFEARNVDGLEVRNVEIDARRTDQESALLATHFPLEDLGLKLSQVCDISLNLAGQSQCRRLDRIQHRRFRRLGEERLDPRLHCLEPGEK